MKDTMDKMEQERAEMVAEVEAQIERALASMAVDIGDSDYGSSRPHSRLSNMSGSQSRRPSDAAKYLRSFGTESTLAESYGQEIEAVEESSTTDKLDRENAIIEEDEEDEELTAPKRKRFSASEMNAPQDGMNAVDEGISQKSDKIAQKVLEIQQKVCADMYIKFFFFFSNASQLETALSTDRRGTKWKSRPSQESGEEELSEVSIRSRPSRSRRLHSKPRSNPRTRSGTTSSTQTSTTIHGEDNMRTPSSHKKDLGVPVEAAAKTPTRDSFLDVNQDEQRVPELVPSEPAAETDIQESLPSVSIPTPVALAEDSDTDFQSAYSASPRESYGSFDGEQGNLDIMNDTLTLQIKSQDVEDRLSAPPKTRRERVLSTSTAIIIRESAEPRPNLITSRSRVASKHV